MKSGPYVHRNMSFGYDSRPYLGIRRRVDRVASYTCVDMCSFREGRKLNFLPTTPKPTVRVGNNRPEPCNLSPNCHMLSARSGEVE